MGADRRRWQRIEIPAKILISPGSRPAFEARVQDISYGGAFILSQHALGFRERIHVTFFPGGGTVEVRVEAEIVHAIPTGFGIEFAPETSDGIRHQLVAWAEALANAPILTADLELPVLGLPALEPAQTLEVLPLPTLPAPPLGAGVAPSGVAGSGRVGGAVGAPGATGFVIAGMPQPERPAAPRRDSRGLPAPTRPPESVAGAPPARADSGRSADPPRAPAALARTTEPPRAAPPRPETAKPPAPNAAPAAGPEPVAPRVLIVQDNKELAKLLVSILHKVGAEPTFVQDSRRAVDALVRASFDLVLIDWLPSDQPAEALLKMIRERRPRLPVVVISALALNPEFIERLRSLGVTEVVKKPFQLRDLIETMDRALAG